MENVNRILCEVNQHVNIRNNIYECEDCEPGKYRPSGDLLADRQITECEWITCDENEYAYINNGTNTKERLACPPGTYNAPGDSLSASNSTKCDAIMCDTGYRVQNHTCVQCESGKYNTENHDASGINTECQWITCDENERVYINGDTKQCLACPPGTYNALEIH